jgi:hypothetical protein
MKTATFHFRSPSRVGANAPKSKGAEMACLWMIYPYCRHPSISRQLFRAVATLRTNDDYFEPLQELIEKLLFHEAAL